LTPLGEATLKHDGLFAPTENSLTPGLDRSGLKGGLLRTLAENEVEQIHNSALTVLARTGIVVHDEKMLSWLGRNGCRVDSHSRRLYLPPEVIDEAVARAPNEVRLCNRLGEEAMRLGAGPFHTRTSSGATGCLDLDSGRRRAPVSQDAINAARLADALPHIHGVSTMAVQPADVSVSTVDVHTVKIALSNTVKPLGYVCLNENLLEAVLAMAEVVVGGEESLRQRPIMTAIAESTSPLQLATSQLAVLQAFALRGLPLTLHAHPIAGLTAPVTLAGELVVTHAEILALLTIAQLLRPGTPVIYGMSSSVPNMRTAANLSGAVEIGLLGVGITQLARRCGIPCIMSAGTDAFRPGAQTMMERLLTLLPPALAGVDLVNLTTLETKITFSLEQLVIDEMALTAIDRYLRGISVNEETLALGLIHKVGPAGAYIETEHTFTHFQHELLTPEAGRYAHREEWEAAGSPDILTVANWEARRILAEHEPLPLLDRVMTQLEEIVTQAESNAEKQSAD
jgi:trimethylamine--corrinoid protein Co-methyltransferase